MTLESNSSKAVKKFTQTKRANIEELRREEQLKNNKIIINICHTCLL